MDFVQMILEHKLKKPERPNAKTCSAEEWAIYSKELIKWDKDLSKLEVAAVKKRVQAAVIPFNTYLKP